MTPKKKKPRYRAAQMFLRALSGCGESVSVAAQLDAFLSPLHDRLRRLQRTWQLLRTAERRGWAVAAAHLDRQLSLDAQALQHRLGDLLGRQQQLRDAATKGEDKEPPSLRLLLEELRQLEVEFEQVDYRLREQRIVAETEPIVLKDLELGPFAIELRLACLAGTSSPGPDCFRCVALDPNPPSRNGSVTHPHVQDAHLCAGDATLPIATALKQGRICDAFCLVRAVLRQYNPQSPYVALEEWEGVRCEDCDRSVDRDDLSCCEHCGHDVCGDCRGLCDLCDRSCCESCLEQDAVSRRSCCPDCRHACAACGRTVDADHFVAEAELCPQCEEDRQGGSEADDSIPHEQENEHAEPDEGRAPASPPAAEPDVGAEGDGGERPEDTALAAPRPPRPAEPLAA
jgi:hypothetical protein